MNRLLISVILPSFLLLSPLVSAAQQAGKIKTPAHSQQSTHYTPPAPESAQFRPANPYLYRPNIYTFNRYRYAQDPVQVIQDTLGKITAFTTHTGSVNPVELRRFIENEIIPYFDFNSMSRWITGPYARYMTATEKNSFQQQLRETFLSSLAQHIGSFDTKDTRIQFAPAQYRGPSEASVRVFIYRRQQPPMRLNFRMHYSENSWRIIDVRANGASAVLYYRNHFIAQLQRYRNSY